MFLGNNSIGKIFKGSANVDNIYQGDVKVWPISSAEYFDYMISLGPLAYWRLGESVGTVAVDEVAGFNGIYINNPTLGVAGLLVGDTDTAIELDETLNQYVNAGEILEIFPTTTFSIVALIHPTKAFTFDSVVSRMWDSLNIGYTFIHDSNDQIRLLIRRTNTTNQLDVKTTAAFPINNTYHIAVTSLGIGAAGVFIYVNGINQALTVSTDNLTTNPSYSGRDMWIGARGIDSLHPFTGALDEVSIHSSALSSVEVLTSANFALGN